MRDAAEYVKNNLSMRDVAERYGLKSNRAGFISCPFHGDKTPSLKIYKDVGKGWHCFGCGKGGSVVDFVMEMFGLKFQQAIMRIDVDFALNLPLERKMTARDRFRLRQQERELQVKKEYDSLIQECFCKHEDRIWKEWYRLALNKRNYRPRSQTEEWHPLYIEALKKLTYQEYLIDTVDTMFLNIKNKLNYT